MEIKPAPDLWLTRPRSRPEARLRLLCFPYAGGGASVFRAWPAVLPGEVEIVPVQLPGRETRIREAAYWHVGPLAVALAQALAPLLDRPFALFGHSMGALVAFELARELRRRGRPGPVHLFVSGRCAPTRPHPLPLLSRISDAELIDQLRRLGGTPEEALSDAGFMSVILPVLRADLSICETYVYTPEEPLKCPISAFGGVNDDHVSRENLLAWRDHTGSEFKLRMFPGSHFFLLDARPRLLQVIAEDLEDSAGAAAGRGSTGATQSMLKGYDCALPDGRAFQKPQ